MHDKPQMSTLHLIQLKIEPDKEHIRHCLLFCFHQKKRAIELFVRRMMKMLQSLERVRIDLNDCLKTKVILVTKNGPNIPRLWKRTNCEKMGKSCGKWWKILGLIYIVTIFLLIKKNCKNQTRTFTPTQYILMCLVSLIINSNNEYKERRFKCLSTWTISNMIINIW